MCCCGTISIKLANLLFNSGRQKSSYRDAHCVAADSFIAHKTLVIDDIRPAFAGVAYTKTLQQNKQQQKLVTLIRNWWNIVLPTGNKTENHINGQVCCFFFFKCWWCCWLKKIKSKRRNAGTRRLRPCLRVLVNIHLYYIAQRRHKRARAYKTKELTRSLACAHTHTHIHTGPRNIFFFVGHNLFKLKVIWCWWNFKWHLHWVHRGFD